MAALEPYYLETNVGQTPKMITVKLEVDNYLKKKKPTIFVHLAKDAKLIARFACSAFCNFELD